MGENAEKRAFRRKSMCQTVRLETKARSGHLEYAQGNVLGVDISNRGIGVITNRRLEEGAVVKLYFLLPETNTSLPIYAKVVWAKPAHGKFRAGLCFWDKPGGRKFHH